MVKLSEREFEYDGLNSYHDLGLIMGHVAMPIAPSMSESVIDIPAKYGNEYYGMNYGAKQIDIPVTVMANNYSEYMQKLRVLSNALIDYEDVGEEYGLRFGDDPEITYWGHWSAIPTPTFLDPNVFDTTLTLTFMCSDPRGYGAQKRVKLNGNIVNTISVGGNTLTEPVMHVIPKRDLNGFGYTINGETFQVGPDNDADDANVKAHSTRVMKDNGGTLVNWSSDADAISGITDEGGWVAQGSANSSANSSAIVVKSFGKMVEGKWYGPVLKHDGIPNYLQDWRVETFLHHHKYSGDHNGRAMARISLLLINEKGQTFGRMGISDQSQGRIPWGYVTVSHPGSHFQGGVGDKHYDMWWSKTKGKIPTDNGNNNFKVIVDNDKGGHKVVASSKKVEVKSKRKKKSKKKTYKTVTTSKKVSYLTNYNNKNALTDFWGKFTLARETNQWKWSVQEYDIKTGLPKKEGKTDTDTVSQSGTWTSSDTGYTTPSLATVALSMQKYAIAEDTMKPGVKYKDPYLSCSDVQIFKLNGMGSAPDIIAHEDDEIIVDTNTQQVTVAGKRAQPSWTTDWPKLIGGASQGIYFNGDISDADITLDYVEKYK